jgi:DNA-binding winged helix-turn-helix (wHTH) protein
VPDTAAVTRPDPPPPARVRFAGVVLDPHGHRLLVDGRQRACSTRAMALLQLLCERPGRVWARTELLDALWPGGQVVADESLSQLVFRLRAALGPYAESIVTVRGVGVRLDAQLEPEPWPDQRPPVDVGGAAPVPGTASGLDQRAVADGEATAPARAWVAAVPAPGRPVAERVDGAPPGHGASARDDGAGRASAGTGRTGSRTPVAVAVGLALVLVLAVGAWLGWFRAVGDGASLGQADPATVVDAGMGLQRGDLPAMSESALALVAGAFEQERLGDRERSQALMEAAHGSDRSSPVPALMLALWSGASGDGDRADRWLAAASERRSDRDAPYLLLLANYVQAERRGHLPDIARQAGALLDLRPDAWFLRLARAHVYGAMGLRERALAELQGIVVGDLDHPRLAMALADRASFGDVAGARAILAGLRPDADNLDVALARARVDWSAGDLAAARAGFVAVAELARQQARLGIRARALAYIGILDLVAGDTDAARASLERARAGARERRDGSLELDLTLLLAHVHAEQGQGDAVRAELRHAVGLAPALPSSDLGFFTRLVALRLAPDLEDDLAARLDEAGGASLMQARRALAAGDRAAARTEVERAVEQGALEARLAEETRLLLAELGLPAPAGPPLDPPHPPLTRFAVRRLADRLASNGRSETD